MSRFSRSKFAARLQVLVSRRRFESGLYHEIAGNLPLNNAQRILDIGTGTGLQLRAIHELHPEIELYGLDLSPIAIQFAREALDNLDVDLRAGSILNTDYADNFFDLATCNSSMSYWDQPGDCFNEIYRILKPGGQAVLFEPHRDIDLEAALDQIKKNLADQGFLRRWAAVQMNRFGLKRGARLGLKLYSIPELQALVRESRFGDQGSVVEAALQNVPIFACLRLTKSVAS